MDSFRRAYLDMAMALASWRASQDCTAQVAHWVLEGDATHADLVETRNRQTAMHRAYTTARARYTKLATLAATGLAESAGRRAYRRDHGMPHTRGGI